MSNPLFTSDAAGATRPATADEILEAARTILARRVRRGTALSNPRHTRDYLRLHLAPHDHEIFAILFLDNRHRVIEFVPLFRGTVDGASVYPREVVKEALRRNAAAVILAHNHPSRSGRTFSGRRTDHRPHPRRPAARRHSRPRPPGRDRRRHRQLRRTGAPVSPRSDPGAAPRNASAGQNSAVCYDHIDHTDRIEDAPVIRKSTAVAARQNFGDLLNQVQYRNDSVLITKDGKPVAALVDVELFERIRRMREDFLSLTDRIGQSYVGVDPGIAEREIAEAVAHARKTTKAAQPRKRR